MNEGIGQRLRKRTYGASEDGHIVDFSLIFKLKEFPGNVAAYSACASDGEVLESGHQLVR